MSKSVWREIGDGQACAKELLKFPVTCSSVLFSPHNNFNLLLENGHKWVRKIIDWLRPLSVWFRDKCSIVENSLALIILFHSVTNYVLSGIMECQKKCLLWYSLIFELYKSLWSSLSRENFFARENLPSPLLHPPLASPKNNLKCKQMGWRMSANSHLIHHQCLGPNTFASSSLNPYGGIVPAKTKNGCGIRNILQVTQTQLLCLHSPDKGGKMSL